MPLEVSGTPLSQVPRAGVALCAWRAATSATKTTRIAVTDALWTLNPAFVKRPSMLALLAVQGYSRLQC